MLKQLSARLASIVLVFAVMCLGGGSLLAQNNSIIGTVVDGTGTPVLGAAVLVPGTTNGVQTDIDGKFEIRVATGTTLEVSCIGYTTRRVTADNNMGVTNEEDTQ